MTAFKQFKTAFIYWQKELGLTSYTAYFKLENLGDCYASIDADPANRVVNVSFNKLKPKDKPANDTPQAIAFHECCHLLFADFAALARDRYASEPALSAAEENIVRTLENVLYNKVK